MDAREVRLCTKEGCWWIYPAYYTRCPRCGNGSGLGLKGLLDTYGVTKLIQEIGGTKPEPKQEKISVIELRSENLTGLGGPMGTETARDNWRKNFRTVEEAQAYAVSDYNDHRRSNGIQPEVSSLAWIQAGPDERMHSFDLGFVMYHIKKIIVE